MGWYKKGSVDNPMEGIERLYTRGGLDALEMDFISKATGVDDNYGHKLAIKKDFYITFHENHNTGEITEDEIFFENEIYMHCNMIRMEAHSCFEKRLDQANSEAEEQFILKKAEKAINNARNFIIDNPKTHCADEHYKFLQDMMKGIHKIYTRKTGNYLLVEREISDAQIDSLSVELSRQKFMEIEDVGKFKTFLKARDTGELSGTIKIGYNNRLFRYLLDKLIDYGILKLGFKEIEMSGFFLNKKGNNFKSGDLYSAKTSPSYLSEDKKPPKNHEIIDQIFLQVLGKKF